MIFLVGISWTVFWMDGEILPHRMGVSFTGILTVVAFQLLISQNLPRVGYLTFLDAVILMSFMLMILTIVENVVVCGFQGGSKKKLAERIDKTCRWAFPLVYILSIVVAGIAYIS